MWADTLLAAERAHLLRLLIWGSGSLLAGTALLAWLAIRHHRSPLLRHFALQLAGWGAVDLVLALLGRGSLALRDVAGATRLDRLLWLNIGLDAGYVMVGATLIVIGWRVGRRLELIGAGTGVAVQGTALLLLDLMLTAQISR